MGTSARTAVLLRDGAPPGRRRSKLPKNALRGCFGPWRGSLGAYVAIEGLFGNSHALTLAVMQKEQTARNAWVWMAAVLVLLALVPYARHAWLAVNSPQEMDYGEGLVFWQAKHVLNLPQAVHPLGQYPYVLFNYPPVFHLATVALGPAMPSLLSAGRLLSVLSLLGICAICGVVIWRNTRAPLRWPLALLAAALPLHLPTTEWSLLMRVDMIGVFFAWAGLVCYMLARKRPALVYAAIAAFTLALYSKQTLISAPVACLVCLLIESPRRFARAMLLLAGSGLAVLAVLGYLTHGEIVRHLFTYNVSPIAARHGLWLASVLVRQSLALLVLSVLLIAGLARQVFGPGAGKIVNTLRAQLTSDELGRTRVLFVAYFLAGCAASFSILKIGANINYMLEPLFAACVLAALVLCGLLQAPQRSNFRAATVLACCALIVVTTLHAGKGLVSVNGLSAPAPAEYRQLLARVQSLPGDVYSEDLTVLLEAHKAVPAEPASDTFLSAVHLWNEQPLVDRFRNLYFTAIVVKSSLDQHEHFSPAVRQAIMANYEQREQFGGYTLYLPRPAAAMATLIQGEFHHE